MKFYNMVVCYLSIISLFSCFAEVAASQVAPVSQFSEVRSPQTSQLQSNISEKNTQIEEDSNTEENGREMLDEDYKKSIENFRRERLARQQKHTKEQEQLDAFDKILDDADKQIAAAEAAEASSMLLWGKLLESAGLLDEALAKYRYADELGNTQARLCFAALYKKLISAPVGSPANTSYEYALRCEKDGCMGVAIGLYEQAAKLGNEQAINRLQILKEAAALNNNNNSQ